MPKETTKQTRRNTAAKKTKSGPKRGLSAYMCFCKEQRANVIKENPNASFGEIGKKLGEKWKKMTDEEKAPYIKMADEDKKRYEAEKHEAEKTEKNDAAEEKEEEAAEK